MRTPTPLYRELANLLQAIKNCQESNNSEWESRHQESIDSLMSFLPSGSGIDSGVKLDDSSTPEKLVFTFGYHHMNDVGMYDGWTDHTLVVKASLTSGIDLRISGRNRNDIKDYLHDTFHHALTSLVWQEQEGEEWVWKTSLYHPIPDCAIPR